MTSRREFIQASVAASAAPLVATGPALAAATAGMTLYKVIYDARFAEGRTFALAAGRLGTPAHPIRGDVTNIWFNDLYHRWSRAPAAIAGLTTPAALFCLEQLARDYRMRVVFHAEHRPSTGGAMLHALTDAALLGELRAAGASWPLRAAQALLSRPANAAPPARPKGASLGSDDILSSWIIAPVRRG
jgi:hypothetical protein